MTTTRETLRRAEQHLGVALSLTTDGRAALRAMADGDGRFTLAARQEIARLPAATLLGPQELAQSCSSAHHSTTRARKATTT
jgi:putative ATPase